MANGLRHETPLMHFVIAINFACGVGLASLNFKFSFLSFSLVSLRSLDSPWAVRCLSVQSLVSLTTQKKWWLILSS